jgi:integrase
VSIVQEKTERTLELPLTDQVINAIAAYLKNGRPHVKSPYVFLQYKAPYQQMRALYDVMSRALTAASISLDRDKSKGLHILRHIFATLALQNGVDIKTVSEMLGHYSAGFILDTYTHVTTSAKREAANTMGSILSGALR